MSQNHNSFKTVLASTPVSSLHTPKGKVVVINSVETPYEGFKTLLENNILSAPVYNESTKKYTGFLDMRDLVSFVVFIDDDQKSEVPNNLHDIIISGLRLFKVPVEGITVTYLSRRNAFVPVSATDNLLAACEILARGVHRVPVVNESGEVVNIISQSTIIQFLHKNASHFTNETSVKVKELGIGSKPVISVNKDQAAIDAFRLMDNKKISGLAVVDSLNGRLLGNTSSSDLKLFIRTPSIEILKQPITHFLNKIRQESIDIRSPTISCSTNDTLNTLIGKLASTKIHKIFIADDADGYKPTLVISITDILRYIMHL